jgi:hypothetical protein
MIVVRFKVRCQPGKSEQVLARYGTSSRPAG